MIGYFLGSIVLVVGAPIFLISYLIQIVSHALFGWL